MKRTNRSTSHRSSPSSAAGGAKKAQKAPSTSSDGWQSTPVRGGGRAAPAVPTAPKKASTPVTNSRFAAFTLDSDSEEESNTSTLNIIPAETPDEFFARLATEDPYLAALARGVSWFEVEHGEDDPVTKASLARIAAERPIREAARLARLAAEAEVEVATPELSEEEQDKSYFAHCHRTEDEFWNQPFTANLEERIPDYYDTSALTDEEFHAMIGWAYSNGWNVDVCGRETVKLVSDNNPPRRYIPHVFWEESHHDHCHGHSHQASAKKVKTATIPRFCRAGEACTEDDCRYVHGDTIPKVNRSCGFGESCGASDPTGVKRSQCLYMHPGETWTTESCIHRPPPAPAAPAE